MNLACRNEQNNWSRPGAKWSFLHNHALAHSSADISIAVTGIAGPGGGSALKPVGLVHCAAARRGGMVTHRKLQLGDIGRDAIRNATVVHAVEMVRELV